MALSSQSLFLFGYTIDSTNLNIDFQSTLGGPVLSAVITLGEYSLSTLLQEIADAMQSADPANTYNCTADRTVMGGTQNRVTIATTGTYLKILFSTGPNSKTSAASILGFNGLDYSGSLSYTGSQTTGTALIPVFYGYSYQGPESQGKVFGVSNISASGLKETVTFNVQEFIDVEFKYVAKSELLIWSGLFNWLIHQNPFDFTPEINSPTTFYPVTLEKTEYDGQGMGFRMKEMLPNFPNLYQTGPLNFRVILDLTTEQFIF